MSVHYLIHRNKESTPRRTRAAAKRNSPKDDELALEFYIGALGYAEAFSSSPLDFVHAVADEMGIDHKLAEECFEHGREVANHVSATLR